MTPPRILLIEDEEHIAQGLIFNLTQEGYQVTHAETGAEAMRIFDSEHFDLVVLDLMLPDSHGIDLCQRMRETSPQLPILILTALGEEQNRVRGLQAGADDYLSKPFNLEEFLLRVSGMLKRSTWYQPDLSKDGSYQFGSNRVDLKNLQADTA
jgi:two-component system alkaline phosphatase synthesis response regulator PhoP